MEERGKRPLDTKRTTTKETFSALRSMLGRHAKALEHEMATIEHINSTANGDYHAQVRNVEKRLEEDGNKLVKAIASRNSVKLLQDQKELANNLDGITQSLAAMVPPIEIEYQIKGIDRLQAAIVECLASTCISRSDGKPVIGTRAIKSG